MNIIGLPYCFRTVKINNRIVMAGLSRGLWQDYLPVQYYVARRSAAIIITEGVAINSTASQSKKGPFIQNIQHQKIFKQIIFKTKNETKLFCQLFHDIPSQQFINQISKGQIQKIKQDYVKAAIIAKDIGFTGVQVHCNQRYFLGQFVSNRNKRNDQYKNGSKLICEVIEQIMKEVGNFPISIKVTPTLNDRYQQLLQRVLKMDLQFYQIRKRQLNTLFKLQQSIKGFKDKKQLMCINGQVDEQQIKILHKKGYNTFSFGRKWVSNPNLPYLFLNNQPIKIPTNQQLYF